jgi:flagellar hook protein FlgE
MGLQSAMTTALTGMQASETVIDVVGNNIANSNTVGFKASDVLFATQFLQTQSIGSAPSDRNGGTNPRQIGLGVKVAEIAPNFSQGTIEISSNPLDLAIQGSGFLMVQGSQGEQLYTRNGQLKLNSENQIVTANGNKLLGYGLREGSFELNEAFVQPLTIALGGERVAQATTEAVFQGVLNPTVNAGTIPAQIQSEVMGDGSVMHPNGEVTTGTGTPSDPFVTTDYFTSADVEIRTPPAPGTAAFSTPGAATPLLGGTYAYRITYVDGSGRETTPSTVFNVTGVPPGDQIDLSALPDLSANPGNPYTSINIYRLDPAPATQQYRLAGSVGMGTTTFTDNTNHAAGALLNTQTLENGSYTYYVTYLNPANNNESRPSAALGPFAVSNNDSSVRLDLSDLQLPTDPNYSRMKIYRNVAGTASFHEIANLPLPTVGADSWIDKAPSATITGNHQLDFDGVGAAGGTLLTDLQVRNGSTYARPFEEMGTLSFTGKVGGTEQAPQSLEITATTTVQDLLDFVNDSLGLQQQSNVNGRPLPVGGGSVSIVNGVVTVTSNYGIENTVDIPLTAFRLTPPGQVVTQTVDLTFSESQVANGPGTSTEFVVYDSLGSPLTVRMTTVLETADSNSTTYRWYASSGDSQPTAPELSTVVGNGLMVFDSRGNLISSPSARISIQRELTASESPLEIELNLEQVTALAETDSSGNAVSSLNMVRQDGFPPGVLTDFIITDSGLIQGQFSNGTQRTLGQVLMARFANDGGLRQVGNGLYSASVNSGDAFVSSPGEDGIGTLTAGAVELSNTDIGQDLVKMILAQTQYQAGSRVISTAQQLLDELLALNR